MSQPMYTTTNHIQPKTEDSDDDQYLTDQNLESQNANEVPSTTLYRSYSILFLCSIYICLATFSWVVICYLSIRPITTSHYGVWTWNEENNGYQGRDGKRYTGRELESIYDRNQQWFHTARVIQSIVGVVAIPLTSTICSSAAVIFSQRRHQYSGSAGLSMRQVITLADKGWADITVYLKIILFFSTKPWKRYGSSFLILAIFANLLGSIISPLQAIFLSTFTIKTPTEPSIVGNLLDLPEQWKGLNADSAIHGDTNSIVVLTRSALITASKSQVQAQLWQGANISCAYTRDNAALSQSCTLGGVTLGNITKLEHPFLAQLSSGYNTGLIQQFIPRINSTARYEEITADKFPKNCSQIDGAFYVNYNETYKMEFDTSIIDAMDSMDAEGVKDAKDFISQTLFWGLDACMPVDLTKTPWRPTRDRQDFTEELFLNISLGYENQVPSFYKISLDTTAGYFELPNYANGGSPGPLLEKDPNVTHGKYLKTEGFVISSKETDIIFEHHQEITDKRDEIGINNDYKTLALEGVANKGPLLTIAMALFGQGSYIQDRLANPQAYTFQGGDDRDKDGAICRTLAPMALLLEQSVMLECNAPLKNSDGVNNSTSNTLGMEISNWIEIFIREGPGMSNAFTAAAFLANKAWMDSNLERKSKSLYIAFDMGHDTQIPAISRTGLVLVSFLLGLDILILFPLAIYAACIPRWTSTLDSFAMMRMGAAVAGELPLLISKDMDKIDALDELPGCIGDRTEEGNAVGQLGLRGTRPLALRINKRFESYGVQ